MSVQKLDRRIVRTRRSLQDSLIGLMLEQGYESITVQDILDRAGVGRSTFYVHFKDKEELLKSAIENLREWVVEHWQASLAADSSRVGGLAFVLPFFRHLEENRRIYRAVVGHESGMIVDRYFRRMFADMARTDLTERAADLQVPLEAAVQHVVGALMSVVAWWIEGEADLTAEQVNDVFVRLSLDGLRHR